MSTSGWENPGSSTGIGDEAALSLIAADLVFFRDLFLDKHFEPTRPIALLALMPWLSAFVFESAAYFEQRGSIPFQELRVHEVLLRTSRLRLKLLDDNRRSFEELLQDASNLAAINSSWFQESHHGIFRRIKQRLQLDLGIFFLKDEVICTSHVAFLNMGLTEEALIASSLSLENLGPYLRDTGEDFGKYMVILLDTLGFDAIVPADKTGASLPSVGFRDLKSERFYEEVARRVAPDQVPLCLLLTSILSQVNSARVIVPLIAERNEVAIFKCGFISLYHAASSLRTILNINRKNNFLRPEAERQIGAILSDDAILYVRKNSKLRNNLFHYGVDERMVASLSPELPLFGLVEAHCSGRSFATVANDVQQGLRRVADGLSGLLVQGITPQGTL